MELTLKYARLEIKDKETLYQMIKEGFDITNFNPNLYQNPFLLAPFVAYLAACSAKDFDRNAYNEKDFTYWAEEQSPEEITRVLDKFYRSLFGDAFMDQVQKQVEELKQGNELVIDKKKVTRKKK